MKSGVFLVLAVFAVLGCKDLTGSQALPSGTPNPSFYGTRSGALGMRAQAIYTLEQALPSHITTVGVLTDELEDRSTGKSTFGMTPLAYSVDQRVLPARSDVMDNNLDYNSLQSVRGQISQALGALVAYDTAAADAKAQKILRGELYALYGYAEILLADEFCSGIPLSTLDFQRDYTYHAGSTTGQVYQDAIAKEDTAIALADTSAQVLNLARVLKGRALLAIDSIAQAAQIVSAVPDAFQYNLAINWTDSTFNTNVLSQSATVSDREGQNGLPFVSSGDPRTAVIVVSDPDGNQTFIPQTFPTKYAINGFTPFIVADGVEARLIQAEAQLQPATAPSGPWLTTLDRLRASIGLPDTTDPGTAAGRIALLFQERAYWQFLTAHRQGDLRRLIRQYGFRQNQVYPIGPYLGYGGGVYGSDVTVPIPGAEYANSLFHGCKDRAP